MLNRKVHTGAAVRLIVLEQDQMFFARIAQARHAQGWPCKRSRGGQRSYTCSVYYIRGKKDFA